MKSRSEVRRLLRQFRLLLARLWKSQHRAPRCVLLRLGKNKVLGQVLSYLDLQEPRPLQSIHQCLKRRRKLLQLLHLLSLLTQRQVAGVGLVCGLKRVQ